MATASDNFDRADAALGANWALDSGAWVVRTNRAGQNTTGGTQRKARYTATPPATADHYSEATCRSTSATGAGVIVRATVAATVTMYEGILYGDDFSYLTEVTGGTEVVLDTGAAYTAGTDVLLRCTANGTAITTDRAGAGDCSATDATLTALGWGLGCFGGVASGITLSWNDWTAADLAAASAIGPLIGGKLAGHSILQGRLIR